MIDYSAKVTKSNILYALSVREDTGKGYIIYSEGKKISFGGVRYFSTEGMAVARIVRLFKHVIYRNGQSSKDIKVMVEDLIKEGVIEIKQVV